MNTLTPLAAATALAFSASHERHPTCVTRPGATCSSRSAGVARQHSVQLRCVSLHQCRCSHGRLPRRRLRRHRM